MISWVAWRRSVAEGQGSDRDAPVNTKRPPLGASLAAAGRARESTRTGMTGVHKLGAPRKDARPGGVCTGNGIHRQLEEPEGCSEKSCLLDVPSWQSCRAGRPDEASHTKKRRSERPTPQACRGHQNGSVGGTSS